MSESLHIVCPHCLKTNRVPRAHLADHPNCGSCKAPLFAAHPIELTSASFEKHIQGNDIPVVVDFWAPWCGPCTTMAPVFAEAAKQREPALRFAKLNTEDEPDLATRHGIRSIPTLVLFKGGREVARQSGALGQRQLQSWLETHSADHRR